MIQGELKKRIFYVENIYKSKEKHRSFHQDFPDDYDVTQKFLVITDDYFPVFGRFLIFPVVRIPGCCHDRKDTHTSDMNIHLEQHLAILSLHLTSAMATAQCLSSNGMRKLLVKTLIQSSQQICWHLPQFIRNFMQFVWILI